MTFWFAMVMTIWTTNMALFWLAGEPVMFTISYTIAGTVAYLWLKWKETHR